MELLLQQHSAGKLNLNAFQLDEIREAFIHLTSRDPNKFWTSGQWLELIFSFTYSLHFLQQHF